MARNLKKALLLAHLGKWQWPVLLAVCLAFVYCGWKASPYFAMYVLGPPEPGTAPRFTGTVRIVKEAGYNRWTQTRPEEYAIRTEHGEFRLACGFRPVPRGCWQLFRPSPDIVYTIGNHWYYGIDYVQYSRPILGEMGYPVNLIVTERWASLERFHRSYLILFSMVVGVYLLLVRAAPSVNV